MNKSQVLVFEQGLPWNIETFDVSMFHRGTLLYHWPACGLSAFDHWTDRMFDLITQRFYLHSLVCMSLVQSSQWWIVTNSQVSSSQPAYNLLANGAHPYEMERVFVDRLSHRWRSWCGPWGTYFYQWVAVSIFLSSLMVLWLHKDHRVFVRSFSTPVWLLFDRSAPGLTNATWLLWTTQSCDVDMTSTFHHLAIRKYCQIPSLEMMIELLSNS